jgi:hypothetical protein
VLPLLLPRQVPSVVIIIGNRLANIAARVPRDFTLHLRKRARYVENAGRETRNKKRQKQPRCCAEPFIQRLPTSAANKNSSYQFRRHSKPIGHATALHGAVLLSLDLVPLLALDLAEFGA